MVNSAYPNLMARTVPSGLGLHSLQIRLLCDQYVNWYLFRFAKENICRMEFVDYRISCL